MLLKVARKVGLGSALSGDDLLSPVGSQAGDVVTERTCGHGLWRTRHLVCSALFKPQFVDGFLLRIMFSAIKEK